MGLKATVEYDPPRIYWGVMDSFPYLYAFKVARESDKCLWLPCPTRDLYGIRFVRKHKRSTRSFETFEQAKEALIEEAVAAKSAMTKRLVALQAITPEICN